MGHHLQFLRSENCKGDIETQTFMTVASKKETQTFMTVASKKKFK